MQEVSDEDSKQFALKFAKALVGRDYAMAYSNTAEEFRMHTSQSEMLGKFESIVPTDWGTVEPIEVVQTVDDWPGKQPADTAWVNVLLGGDVYSEAITIVVVQGADGLRVREVEFGRP